MKSTIRLEHPFYTAEVLRQRFPTEVQNGQVCLDIDRLTSQETWKTITQALRDSVEARSSEDDSTR